MLLGTVQYGDHLWPLPWALEVRTGCHVHTEWPVHLWALQEAELPLSAEPSGAASCSRSPGGGVGQGPCLQCFGQVSETLLNKVPPPFFVSPLINIYTF